MKKQMNNECCKRLLPEEWDQKEIVWRDKPFYRDRYFSFLHVPLNFGGKIIPGIIYTYQIKAVKSGIQSQAVEKTGTETRGLKGDNNRSARIDGRDIENLAKHYGAKTIDAGFDALSDTTFDGVIDGSDLIDIGANFALTYK